MNQPVACVDSRRNNSSHLGVLTRKIRRIRPHYSRHNHMFRPDQQEEHIVGEARLEVRGIIQKILQVFVLLRKALGIQGVPSKIYNQIDIIGLSLMNRAIHRVIRYLNVLNIYRVNETNTSVTLILFYEPSVWS